MIGIILLLVLFAFLYFLYKTTDSVSNSKAGTAFASGISKFLSF